MKQIIPIQLIENALLLEEQCALCKGPFLLGDLVILCPEDEARHHLGCWEANGNRCTAYGCQGAGSVVGGKKEEEMIAESFARQRSKIRTLPSFFLSLRRGCAFLFVTFGVLLIGMSCYAMAIVVDLIQAAW